MATRITPPKKTQSAAPDEGADDLAVLNPDATVTITGRELTVREYRFVHGLRVRAKARGLVKDLRAQMDTGEMLTEDVVDVLATHEALVRELMVEAIDGADADWIDGLDDADGETVLLTWWGVCGPFFIRQIARRLTEQVMLQAYVEDAETHAAGSISSPASPPPATDRPTSSDSATPSVN